MFGNEAMTRTVFQLHRAEAERWCNARKQSRKRWGGKCPDFARQCGASLRDAA
jgi:hypothetical protein